MNFNSCFESSIDSDPRARRKQRKDKLRLRRRGFNDRISNDLNFMPSASTNG
jgi:hypothetical protein